MPDLAISRPDFIELVQAAAYPCAEETRRRLREVARATTAVAAGHFHCDGVACIARQARVRHQGFQEAYDRAMASYFGVPVAARAQEVGLFEPFVAEVTDA